jgi:hypothetical protein
VVAGAAGLRPRAGTGMAILALGWANSGARGAGSAIAGLAVLLLLVGWYLFGKENVVEYFHALEGHEAAARPRPTLRS